ncbi:hypothetical protein [Methylomusa anaerophila]|uniref:Uncharacterized protein n=1 Tax=Methylomusa anaerophila TaxID=1930071 RepID=A0A348AR42_9FIRM|nr:hypothetical protein [Methylomusa anaerophila]BBB93540.1 hypothetical protein MAMMFC1_04258 [Methylomusa anaerophila]
MTPIWYVCDGEVETYSGQEADWKCSAVVIAPSPEEALIKVMQYHQQIINHVEVFHNGKTVVAI